MNSAMTAGIAGLGLFAVASKSAVDISEAHTKAENDLSQALQSRGLEQSDLKALMDDFISTNRAYISDQSEVIDGYATLTRAGLSVSEVQKDMNRAVDLAALKHISLSDAVALVNAAEHGRLRGLIDLGITSKAYVDSSGNIVNANKNMALVMAELDAKTAHGRDTTTEMTQASNRLSNDWQDIANNVGPPLVGAIDDVARAVDWVVHELKALGENKQWADAVSGAFGHWQDLVVGLIDDVKTLVGWLQDAANWIGSDSNAPLPAGAHRTGSGGHKTAAGGFKGMVTQPTWFLTGEAGPEHVSISPTGGGGGGSPTIVNHFHISGGLYADGPGLVRLSNEIARVLSYQSGT